MSITQFCGVSFEYVGDPNAQSAVKQIATIFGYYGVLDIVKSVRVDHDDNTVSVNTKDSSLSDDDFGKLKLLAEALRRLGFGFDILNKIRFDSDEPEHGNVGGESGQAGKNALDVQVGGSHYKKLAIQPVEYIFANKIPYLEGNVIKYVTRHSEKGGKKDIEKAIHYLQMILEMDYKN